MITFFKGARFEGAVTIPPGITLDAKLFEGKARTLHDPWVDMRESHEGVTVDKEHEYRAKQVDEMFLKLIRCAKSWPTAKVEVQP